MGLALKIISIVLFVIGFFEMVGLGFYISAVSQSSSTACCGIISYDSFEDSNACDSADITGSAIEHTTDDEGNVWCTVNGAVCNTRTLDNGLTTTLSQCFNNSGHSVSSLCSEEALETVAEDAEIIPIVLCGLVLLLLLTSTLATILSVFGCCDGCKKCKENMMASECCRSQKCATRCMLFNICFALVMWAALVLISDVWMDSILEDGYALDSVDSIAGFHYSESSGSFDDIADDVDVPSYLTGDVYEWVNIAALALGVAELLFFIKLQCLNHTLRPHDTPQHVQETTA